MQIISVHGAAQRSHGTRHFAILHRDSDDTPLLQLQQPLLLSAAAREGRAAIRQFGTQLLERMRLSKVFQADQAAYGPPSRCRRHGSMSTRDGSRETDRLLTGTLRNAQSLQRDLDACYNESAQSVMGSMAGRVLACSVLGGRNRCWRLDQSGINSVGIPTAHRGP